MRWHDLRHTYGSLLAASGEELVTIKAAMGHANITTTEVYLHARPATELAKRFSKAFASTTPTAGGNETATTHPRATTDGDSAGRNRADHRAPASLRDEISLLGESRGCEPHREANKRNARHNHDCPQG
jgi:hypothetical protein